MPASQVCISKRTFYIFSFAVIAIAVTLLLSSLIISNQNLTLSKAANVKAPLMIPVGGWGNPCEEVGENSDPNYNLVCNKDVGLFCKATLDF
ncbi:hypothetical protein A2960_03025 [Candidatus Gottesmanbacteria bacterium RIFCSPLOWO2_01_FULL_39_12b]|uniref:Uncharacterized protein n=1 Tax=Candidatus Gottesmanbacteria bacterium RIFCSPLOWO2_01_FULL_39_12b TaxID=1798388 RepID=A0A1F6AR00_9BACT|nr:MAG: hypothetical protein A2960_03025 [Candidatus Gottesmanbacteria bacterium RIFCSPLOWO2_01_FULL_39_12b]